MRTDSRFSPRADDARLSFSAEASRLAVAYRSAPIDALARFLQPRLDCDGDGMDSDDESPCQWEAMLQAMPRVRAGRISH